MCWGWRWGGGGGGGAGWLMSWCPFGAELAWSAEEEAPKTVLAAALAAGGEDEQEIEEL
jgi:hypothetical protein